MKYPICFNTGSLYAIVMKTILFFAIFILFIGCTNTVKKDDTSLQPKNSRLVTVNLIDSLGSIQLYVPNRYDTFFQWTNLSDCGKPCEKIEYRYQPSDLPITQESGFLYDEPADSIERFTILHSGDFPFRSITEENYIQNVHIRMRKDLQMNPATHEIKFDTIQKIDDRYYSIFIVDQIIGTPLQYSKKVLAATTIRGNGINFNYELLTKKADSVTRTFIDNSLELLKSIRISNGI